MGIMRTWINGDSAIEVKLLSMPAVAHEVGSKAPRSGWVPPPNASRAEWPTPLKNVAP